MNAYSLTHECIFAGKQCCQTAIGTDFNIPGTVNFKECQVTAASPPLLGYTIRLCIPPSLKLDPRSERSD